MPVPSPITKFSVAIVKVASAPSTTTEAIIVGEKSQDTAGSAVKETSAVAPFSISITEFPSGSSTKIEVS